MLTREQPVVQPPAIDATELVELRSMKGKVWDRGGGKRSLRQSIAPIHVPTDIEAYKRGDPVEWSDIDETPFWDDTRKCFSVTAGWYDIEVKPDEFSFIYTSKWDGKQITVRLAKLAGQDIASLAASYAPIIQDDSIVFVDVVKDLDLSVKLKSTGVEIFKCLRSADAPRQFEWEYQQDKGAASVINFQTAGLDNQGMVARGADEKTNRAIEVNAAVSAPEDVAGKTRHVYSEEWTGKTVTRDPITRVPEAKAESETIYPVLIDQDIVEPVAANGDDGAQTSALVWATRTHYFYGDRFRPIYSQFPTWRFTTIAIPQGATIDLANLKVDCGKVGAGLQTGAIYADDVDTAPVFSSSDLPSAMTKTSASYTLPSITSTGLKTFTITSIIQEIVSRAGWVSGNDMRLAAMGGVGYRSIYFDDLGATLNTAAILEVDYTSGGGGTSIPVIYQRRRQMEMV